MNIFESLEELNVSEECFDDIVTMVEAMISETKKARKEVQREAEFHLHHPAGMKVFGLNQKNSPEQEQAKKNLKYFDYDGDAAVAQSLKDVRALEDRPSVIKNALGRGDGWGSRFPKPSKSSQAIHAYKEYKRTLDKLKNDIKRETGKRKGVEN